MNLKKLLYIISVFTLLTNCVSKSKHEDLKNKNLELRQKLNKVEKELKQYKLKETEQRLNDLALPYVTEKQALAYIKDNYEFFERDKKYKNVKLRRSSKNSFVVALDECGCIPVSACYNFPGDCFNAVVKTLTIYAGGKYDFN